MVLALVPLQTIIASATEGELFHFVCHATDNHLGQEEHMLRNGRLSLRFQSGEICLDVKESVDKYCFAYEKKNSMDITDILEKCSLMGTASYTSSPSCSKEMGDWTDFQ
mmetsp:Transcript_29236/g.70520  ORF Transcript_29236/g.70520 Transcript_29236/m.70520 type:complete len:109 (+) Transcript_29236:2-328(+)